MLTSFQEDKFVYVKVSYVIIIHLQVLVHNHAEKDGSSDGALVDFRGNPVDKSRTGGWLGAGLILGRL